ncbi:DUF1707 domain-containing protein [Corynebacterium sp.]|uniref:DUF1707 SHOCT-like domain-containing protein n=1 Tax=Corynebacterium sp. TaxID=1720 RepID=UPI0026DD3E49|nr:DUF1707 domain-containing protein [Corynebacterium sp.]MDO5031085.1 DUF1707 domain-containing protein [Corynebacterium sp.]
MDSSSAQGGTPDRNPDIRASDAERTAALDRLGVHFAEGLLDITEFEERTGKAAAARTRGELAQLFTDLPDDAENPADSAQAPQVAVDHKAEEELRALERRGALVGRLDSIIWTVAIVFFFVGMFVFDWDYFWVAFPLAGVASMGVRGIVQLSDEDEELYDELKSDKDEKRAERLRLAAQRRKELGQ